MSKTKSQDEKIIALCDEFCPLAKAQQDICETVEADDEKDLRLKPILARMEEIEAEIFDLPPPRSFAAMRALGRAIAADCPDSFADAAQISAGQINHKLAAVLLHGLAA